MSVTGWPRKSVRLVSVGHSTGWKVIAARWGLKSTFFGSGHVTSLTNNFVKLMVPLLNMIGLSTEILITFIVNRNIVLKGRGQETVMQEKLSKGYYTLSAHLRSTSIIRKDPLQGLYRPHCHV